LASSLSIRARGPAMNTIIYIVGLVVVVGFLLSFFGLR
jgi:hypothetical protein